MAVSRSDIKFYLTSVEPEIAQGNLLQSVGGYISTSTLYPSTTLTSDLDLYGNNLELASFSDFTGLSYVSSNFEIIGTQTIEGTSIPINTRAVNNQRNFHASSDLIYGLTVDGLFNLKFNDDRKQYRCIAIKNENSSDSALNAAVYLRQNTINASSLIRIAVEIPKNDYHSSSATSGSQMTLVDSPIAGTFEDNQFQDAVLRMTGGLNSNQSRIVNSYDDATGTFVLQSSLPFDVSPSDAYEVDAGPAQRLTSGFVSPQFGTDRVTALSEASASSFVNINVSDDRDHGSDLRTNDVIYVWLERALVKDSPGYNLNSAMLTFNYFTV